MSLSGIIKTTCIVTVADPGFSWGWRQLPKWCANLFFAENYIKMKEFGPPEGIRQCVVMINGFQNII